MINTKKEERVKLDEILKSLFAVSKKVLITMMNSLFKENFDVEMTEITFENNEFVSDDYDIIQCIHCFHCKYSNSGTKWNK